MNNSDLFYFDPLKMYCGSNYVLDDTITIIQPTIGEIVEHGERDYYNTIYTITATPSDMKATLWDMGVDWEDVSDFALFQMIVRSLPLSKTNIILGDRIDFEKLQPVYNESTEEEALVDVENDVYIDRLRYMRLVGFLRKMHGLKANVEKALNKRTKIALIELDRQNALKNKQNANTSYLLPLITSLKVRMGYTKEHILNMGIFEFMEDLRRVQVINQADHMLNGCYSGMVDASKFNKKDLNWLRDLSEDG